MKIKIEKPSTFSLTGQRANNQDFVYPVDEQSRLFIVCDGIGGWDKGEVASRLVAQGVAQYFEQHPTQCPDATYFTNALAHAHAALTEYLHQNPLVSRLGTTLALMYLPDAGAVVAHVGDSRVYQIRGTTILHQTQDHKYVHELVAEGIITQEQALNHPRRNTLSRSVGVDSKQFPPRIDKVEITYLPDIQEDDYFFLCTDGVLEQVDDERLTAIFAQSRTTEEVAAHLLVQCRELTRDNYSVCLVRVTGVSRDQADFPFVNSSQKLWD